MQCFSAEGRRSLDAGLTANETIDSKQRSYRVGLVCGLFIEKTYDYISYRFLLSVMEKNGFWAFKDKVDLLLHIHNETSSE